MRHSGMSSQDRVQRAPKKARVINRSKPTQSNKTSTKEQLANGCIDHGLTFVQDGDGLLELRPHYFVRVHRLRYAEHLGITLEQLGSTKVLHTCKNHRCINPRHMTTLGTVIVNTALHAQYSMV